MGYRTADIGSFYGNRLDHRRDSSAGDFLRKSPKSENGRLESRAGWKGLCRKGMTLLFVLIAVRLDLLMGTNYLRDAVCIAFIANEALSILENAGLMGMPIPEVLRQAIDILNGKAEKYTESRGER